VCCSAWHQGDLQEHVAIPERHRELALKQGLVLAASPAGEHTLHGRLAHVSVFDTVLSPEQLSAIMNVSDTLLPCPRCS
jgi:hypothetical protein